MIGAIAGDVIGSVYEGADKQPVDFDPLFSNYARPTDDTVLTIAVADWILQGEDDQLVDLLKYWSRRYPAAGYGATYFEWAMSQKRQPYHSWGNGSAMRVSPVGFAFSSPEEVLRYAEQSAAVTHNHPEGIKGAQAVALAIFLARTGKSKEDIQHAIESRFEYNLSTPLAAIRPYYFFDVSCQGSVPQAIRAFLESVDFESAVRLAISLGGDTDTIACIAGGIAQAFYGVPEPIRRTTRGYLEPPMLRVLDDFSSQFGLEI